MINLYYSYSGEAIDKKTAVYNSMYGRFCVEDMYDSSNSMSFKTGLISFYVNFGSMLDGIKENVDYDLCSIYQDYELTIKLKNGLLYINDYGVGEYVYKYKKFYKKLIIG